MAISGLANGPLDIALFTLRQRRTDPAWMGRAFTVSMNLNFSGFPIGAAVAGVLVDLFDRGRDRVRRGCERGRGAPRLPAHTTRRRGSHGRPRAGARSSGDIRLSRGPAIRGV